MDVATEYDDDQPAGQADGLEEVKPWHEGLTDKQRRFVEEYVKDQNGAAAARRAGYSEKSDDEMAYENLRKPQIRAAIDAYLNVMSMSAAEAVHKLTEWGRGTLAHFITVDGQVDIESDVAKSHLHLLKEFEQVKTTHSSESGVTEVVRSKIKLNDPMTAVSKILEVHGRIIQRRDVTSAGKAISNVVFYMPDNSRDEATGATE